MNVINFAWDFKDFFRFFSSSQFIKAQLDNRKVVIKYIRSFNSLCTRMKKEIKIQPFKFAFTVANVKIF